jgi:DNA-binding beta-propeller fold protein YncE/predicted Ser/Thr protein kinase
MSVETLLGSEVAGYRIEALLGRGGMGAVYRAEDVRLGRKVALKLIAPELAENERFRERFLRESRLAALLDHPNIVPIHQAGEERGVLFLSMRYVEGTDLGKLVAQEGPLEPTRAVAIVEQVAAALDAAHDQGLVHRDVKPNNILVSPVSAQEHCYLADFGLSRLVTSVSSFSAPSQVVGTHYYIAPEQIRGELIDRRADAYSLGCVLYECLTGAPPFKKGTDVALLWAHMHEKPLPASERRPELARGLDAVLARALAKDPDHRYATCGELAAAARVALEAEAPPLPRRVLRQAVAALATIALGAGVAVALFLVLGRGDGNLSSVSPNAVGVIDLEAGTLVAEVPVGVDPEAVAVGEGGVWVANVEDETVSRIDPKTRRLVRTTSIDKYPSDVAAGEGSVWVAHGAWAELSRIDPQRNEAAEPIAALGEVRRPRTGFCVQPLGSVAVGAGAVWFACDGDLGRVDPETGKSLRVGYEAGLLTSPSAVRPEFSDIAFGLGSLWLANRAGNSVVEVDPATNRGARQVTVGRAPSAVAVGWGAVWVANFEDDTVSRIDVPGRGQPVTVKTILVGDGPVDVAVGEGGVWVANSRDRTVSHIDPKESEVGETIEIGSEPRRVAAGAEAVWVTVHAPQRRGDR